MTGSGEAHGDRAGLIEADSPVNGSVSDSDTRVLVDLTDERESRLSLVAPGPRTVRFVDLVGEYGTIKDEVDAAIEGVLNRGDFVLGGAVDEFERSFADFCGVSHAVGVNSGYSALELILRAHDIGPGDEVITAANTFVATVGAIEACGASPVLVDVDPLTYNLDPHQLGNAITARTRAVIPVHLYGQPSDMADINRIAQQHGLWVFEDACQAHGASYGDRRAGALGDAAAFSFYPSKNLGAYGDGGIVVTDDEQIAERVRLLRNLGTTRKYHHEVIGFNRRLDTLQAAVLGVKLQYLEGWNESRRNTAVIYNELLGELPVSPPHRAPDADHVYHLFVIQTDHRDELQGHLDSKGVDTGIHYPIPVHLQPAFTHLGSGAGSFPITETAAERILSLPMYPNMSVADAVYVAQAVRDFYGA